MVAQLGRLKPATAAASNFTCEPISGARFHLELAQALLQRKRKRRRSRLLLTNHRLDFKTIPATTTMKHHREATTETPPERPPHLVAPPRQPGARLSFFRFTRLPLMILLLLQLSLFYLILSDYLAPSSSCLLNQNGRGRFGLAAADASQVKVAFKGQKSLIMEQSGSIFGSLLGGGGGGGGSSGSGSNNGNSAAQLQQQQQLLIQQQQAADLHQSYKNGQTSDKVTLPGDILLGGLFPIHMKGTKVECGEINRDRGIQRLEAMLYALDRINEDSNLLPGIKLGAILLDSCSSSTYALNQSLEFIRASINTVESSAFECKDKSAPRPKYGSKMIAGVIGGSYSEVSLQVANLLRLFRIPQVSYASTGTALSDKTLYDLFARTVPSDMFQARAIADIVLKLKWSYVSLVSSEGLYGDSGSREFMKQASVRQICIATHEKISPTTDNNAYDLIVSNLLKRNATGVVLFTRAEDTRELLLAVKRAGLFHNFAWVAADGWGTHQKLIEGVEEVAWGAITVELSAKAIPGFDQYMKDLTPVKNRRNPWFSEYWQEWFNCQLDSNLVQQQQVASGLVSNYRWPAGGDSSAVEAANDEGRALAADYDVDNARKRRRSLAEPTAMCGGGGAGSNSTGPGGCPHLAATNNSSSVGRRSKRHLAHLVDDGNNSQRAGNVKQRCSPNLQISESNGYRQEQKVQFVVDAVYAMAHALHRAWFNLCDAETAVVCEALKELNGGDFYSKYLLNVSFEDLAGSEVKFDERGDGLGRYNIYNFRQLRSPQTLPSNRRPTSPSSSPAGSADEQALTQPPDSSFPATNPDGQADNNNADGVAVYYNRKRSAAPLDNDGALASLDDNQEGQTEPIGGLAGQVQVVAQATSKQQQQQQQQQRQNQLDEQPQVVDGVFEYSAVGRWTESDYNLELDDIEFIRGDRSVPESYCSRPCELGQAKIMRAGDHCCWICKTCAPYEYLPDEFSCQDCGIGRWPIQNKTSCYDLPLQYLRWDSPYSLATLAFACLGIACTLFVIFIFIRYLDTPVVKASGRELSFILLAGTASCHLSTFVLLAKPTIFICGSQRFLVNFGFALMYASLLVKTNRISRIFNCARKSAKRPSFISPKSQMLITGILVAIQIFLTIVWFVFEPPGIRAEPPEGKRDQLILKCRAKGKSFIISLVYNMILITTCTVYAIKTRKIPENFNESKFIGFTMYTTIVIWMAFVTMFFGTHNSFETQILTMCICISLSAYSTLFCLFGPKISIILFHPDKNVRKLTMNSAQYKRPFKPVSSMASVDGRNNNTGGTYNGQQTDGGSGGPMSTTSNVLNPAESQAGRLHESSVVSNVVNSNSAGSNFSNSQKTPTTLSQQLNLVGSCPNCGAHQLAQVPINAHAHHLPAPTGSHQVGKGGAGNGSQQSAAGKQTGECAVAARQVASSCSALGGGGAAGSHATILKSSLASGTGQSSSQFRLDGAIEGAGKSTSSASGGARSSSILISSGNLVGSGHKQTGATAKVLHSKIPSSASSIAQPASEQHLFKRISSEEHLLADNAHHCAHHEVAKLAASNGIASAGAVNSAITHRRPRMASLSRLNEFNGTTTTSSHCGHDESISSLANDSFANTSQENTPCTGGSAGGHHAHPLSSAGGQRYSSGKGSDSMLWNQSVYSIDYCSDCCPSYCHSFCPGCSSNGCDGETGSTGGGGGGGGGGNQATCIHASSGTVLDSMQQQQAADTDPDDFDSALCDQSIGGGGGQQSRQLASALDEPAARSAGSSMRRRKSEEPLERPPEPTSYYYDCEELYHRHHKAVCASNSSTSAGTSATMVARSKFRDNDNRTPPKQTSRSQTMEMRTIVVDKSGAGKLKMRQSVDEDVLVQAAAQTSKQLSKQHKLAGGAGGQAQPTSPLVYTLQAAASSAYTVAQMAATAGVQQQQQQQDLQYAGSGAKHQFVTSSKDKYSDKVAATRQSTAMAIDIGGAQRINIAATGVVAAAGQATDASSQPQLGQTGGGCGGGAIQLGLEMVKSIESSRRKSTDHRRHNQRKSSCFSYHDDYEYSYGLVQSNSDSENYYPEEFSGEGDNSAGSMAKDETSDDMADNYEEDEDDFEHDGRLTIARPGGESGTPKQALRAEQQTAGARHRLMKATPTSSIKYKGSAGSSSSSLTRQSRVTTTAAAAAASAASATSTTTNTTSSRDLQLDDHRINSVALIAATLSAGGAIVESSGGASSSQYQQQQPIAGGDKFTVIQQQKQRQEQNQPQRNVEDEKQQTEQVGFLTSL